MQEVVKAIGLVGMNINSYYAKSLKPEQIVNPALVQEYVSLSEKFRRLSVNFRFNTGKATLDNRAGRDLDRVVSYLKDKLEKRVVLAGFADNGGDYNYNYQLPHDRAEVVAEQLRARGVRISRAMSCGEELPVAATQSKSRREKTGEWKYGRKR